MCYYFSKTKSVSIARKNFSESSHPAVESSGDEHGERSSREENEKKGRDQEEREVIPVQP